MRAERSPPSAKLGCAEVIAASDEEEEASPLLSANAAREAELLFPSLILLMLMSLGSMTSVEIPVLTVVVLLTLLMSLLMSLITASM